MSSRLAACAALAFSVLLACFPPSARAADSANLLVNPGFEDGRPDHAWMPAGWDTSVTGLPTVFFGRDTMVVHGGRCAVNVANVSTLLPLWHNWSQTLIVGPETWNKDAVFSIWTRSNGVQGRGYVLLQAYRDTVGKMARIWKVPRELAMERLNIVITSDPYVYLGTQREYFSESETGWVRREVRVFVPPSTDLLIVRAGLFGTGQVYVDDASLTLEPARPAPELPVGVNLIRDPGFEGDGNAWEYSLPPYDNMLCERDTLVAHSGKASVGFTGGMAGMVSARAGVAQVISNRSLSGKRVRLSAWIRCDSLKSTATIKIFATRIDGDAEIASPGQLTQTTPWSQLRMEMDIPQDTYQVWAWVFYNAPSEGKVYFDDVSLEVLGPAGGSSAVVPAQTPPPAKPAKPKPPGRRLGR